VARPGWVFLGPLVVPEVQHLDWAVWRQRDMARRSGQGVDVTKGLGGPEEPLTGGLTNGADRRARTSSTLILGSGRIPKAQCAVSGGHCSHHLDDRLDATSVSGKEKCQKRQRVACVSVSGGTCPASTGGRLSGYFLTVVDAG
jgi:hypothetical protein